MRFFLQCFPVIVSYLLSVTSVDGLNYHHHYFHIRHYFLTSKLLLEFCCYFYYYCNFWIITLIFVIIIILPCLVLCVCLFPFFHPCSLCNWHLGCWVDTKIKKNSMNYYIQYTQKFIFRRYTFSIQKASLTNTQKKDRLSHIWSTASYFNWNTEVRLVMSKSWDLTPGCKLCY
jgi:hypothetical protein